MDVSASAGEQARVVERRWFRIVLAGVAALSAIRLVVLFITPLELYPDEAQYWLWSRRLAFGYFSKPPLVAWLIRLTTAMGGDAEPWVRLSSLMLQGAAPLLLYKAGERLSGPRVGALAALIYSLMPAIQLSAGLVSTDAPLLACLAGALWAYVALWTSAEPDDARAQRPSLGAAGALGGALGLALLSKYAAAYFVIGLVLHACVSPRARRLWTWPTLATAVAIASLILLPHVVWSFGHGFSAVVHVAGNAQAQSRVGLLHPRGALGFTAGQFGVFGPIPLALLAIGTVRLVRRGALTDSDRLLLCLTAPALAIVFVEAVAARANVNWAAAAYVPASVLAADWLVRWRMGRTVWAIVASQGALAALFLLAAAVPAIADAAGLGPALKRARGGMAQAALLERELARARESGPVSAVATDYRFAFNSLAYYGRHLWARPDAPPLRMWRRYDRPRSQADAESPLTAAEGARVLFLSYVKDFVPEERADFAAVGHQAPHAIPIGPRRTRAIDVFVGLGFHPRPRDPTTGLPPPA